MSFFRKSPSAAAAVARPALPDGLRVYAIGDVHGRLDLFDEVLDKIDRNEMDKPIARSLTVVLGDMIDRGPKSREVVQRILGLSARRWILAMRGNHEQCLLDFLQDPEVLTSWGQWGAFPTLLSYGLKFGGNTDAQKRRELQGELLAALPPAHLAFFRELPVSFSCHGYFFAHAGVRPGIALDKQQPEDLLWIREEFLAYDRPFERIIIHGHTPVPEPEVLPHRINIDTGAYATGRLTCLMIEGDRISFL